MFKKLRKLLTKDTEDPSVDWPILETATPDIDTAERRVGPLNLGDDVSKASIFGKPDLFDRVDSDTFNLIYARAGFQIEFQKDKLTFIAYFVADDPFGPDCSNLNYCAPKIDGTLLNESFRAEDIDAGFGSPESVDKDSDETILFYRLNSLPVEFELNVPGQLKRVNIYSTKD